jgi:uncharacterized protein with HEPN domain
LLKQTYIPIKTHNYRLEHSIAITYESFLEDELIPDAILRNLEVIGEAVKKYSPRS